MLSAYLLDLVPLHRQPGAGTPESPDSIPGLFFLVALILAFSVVHFTLRWMDRRGWVRYRGLRARRGVGAALVTLNGFFQPHHRGAEQIEIVHAEPDDQGDGNDAIDEIPKPGPRMPSPPAR